MPILRIDSAAGELVQKCANCGTYNPVKLAALVLGDDDGEHVMPDRITLPACPTCKAQEYIFRTWDEAPKATHGTHFHGHRAAVNRLAKHLAEGAGPGKGQVHKSDKVRAHHRHTGHDTPDMHESLDAEIPPLPARA